MNKLEQGSRYEEMPDFGLEAFGIGKDFDINAAFQEAMQGVASDTDIALEEKVQRMEVIIREGTSEVYRDYVDFRQMATQMAIMCSHDHVLGQSMKSNETLLGFLDSHKADHGHNHDDSLHEKHDSKTNKKTKKKKRTSWFSILMK